MRPGQRGAAALLLAAAACAAPQPLPGGRAPLAAVEFEGNRALSSSELRSKIASTPSGGLFRPVLRPYDPDLFDVDLERVLRWYRQKGFFLARVAGVTEARDADSRVVLTVKVEEGPRARVAALALEGVQALDAEERAQVAGRLPLQAGEAFDEEAFEKAKAVLEAQLKEHGFAAASVEGEAVVAADSTQATVTLRAGAGPRYRLGRITVVGNRAVGAELIQRATGLVRGEWFASSKLDLAQQRIYNLGPFSGVRVGLEPLGEGDVAAVRIAVREAPFQTVRLGLGLQIENARWELPRLRAEYTNRNFLGGARRLELATQAGYALTPGPFAPEKTGLVTLSTAQLTLPAVLLPGLDFVSRGEFSRELQSGFDYSQVAARFALLLRLGRLSVSPSFNLVRTFAASLALDLGSLLTQGGSSSVGLLDNCLPACSLLYPELRVSFDARDNALEPRRGLWASMGLQRTLFGSFRYWRFEPEVRAYLTVGSLTLAARGAWGALYVLKGGSVSSPFTQRFFGGGQGWQRGYGAGRQGPKVGAQPDPVTGYATAAVPVGGNGALLLSGELRLQTDFVLRNSGVVAFLDASRVTEEAELPLRSALEFAPGLGLRYLTPFGPVRLDVAFLLNPIDVLAAAPRADLPPTPAGAGCSGTAGPCVGEPRFAWHLTLGEAF